MSEHSLELLNRIRTRLRSTARRMTLAELLFGLAITAGVFSAVWTASTAFEAGFWLATPTRTVLFWSILLVVAGLFCYFVLLPTLRFWGAVPGPSAEYVASRIGDRFPQIGDRLVNLLDISEGRRTESPNDLVDGAVRMLGSEVEPVPIENVEDFGRAKRAVRFAALPVLALLLFLTAAPSTFMDASRRILSPGVHFDRPAPFQLSIEPGTVELARGSAMAIRVEPKGRDLPRSIILSLHNLDEEHVEQVRLSPDSTGAFRHELANVRKSFRYRVAASPVTSRWYEATVTEYPMVRRLQVTLDFPAYAGLPSQQLDANVGDVTGLPGTTVSLDIAVGGSEASNAYIAFDDGSMQPLEVSGRRASGSFRLQREGSYQVVVETDGGLANRDPIAYSMNLLSDASPSIAILQPETDATLSENLRKRLETRISDDFGFHDLTLFYRLAESRFGDPTESFSAIDLPLADRRQLDQDVDYHWALSEATDLDPVPGDVIEYYVRVRDNDAYAGFKAAETSRQRLRLPSLAEQYEQLDQEQNEVENRMESVLDGASRLDEQFRELRDEIRRKQDADWEDKRQLEQIQQQQEQLEQQVEDLSEQVQSMNESMQQNNLMSEETLEMYQEMQKVVEEINSPQLMEALRQLQQAVEELNLSEMQQAIENFEFNEDQYKQRLERALELFKNLRAQQGLEEAARRAEELAKQQEQLAEQTTDLMNEDPPEDSEQERRDAGDEEQDGDERTDENSPSEGGDADAQSDEGRADDQTPEGEQHQTDENGDTTPSDQQSPTDQNRSGASEQQNSESPSEELARRQELSRGEMQQLEELLRKLQEQVEEMKKGPAEDMGKLNESLQQQQMPQQMQQNAEQLRQNQLQDARSGQQQMQQQLQQLQNQLSQMQSNMQGSQMQVNMAGLRRALGDILTLSKQQEDLRAGLRNNVSEAPSMREDARRQVELSEGLSSVVDSLQELGKNIPQMSREVQRQAGEALREMGRATESMTDRSVGKAAGHQKASMMHLNELALLLSEVMNQLMNMSGSGSGSGNMQQMIQQMQQMAQQQQQLNQQMQEFLNDIQGNRLSVDMQQRLKQMSAQQQAIKKQLDGVRRNPEARGKLLGDLEKIGQQMEETIEELARRQVDPRTIERQQQILQRLLDAQRSINQRGEEDKRQAEEGRDILRDGPGELPADEAADKLRRDLIRALESGYAPDYEDLIKRYFELLQKQNAAQD